MIDHLKHSPVSVADMADQAIQLSLDLVSIGAWVEHVAAGSVVNRLTAELLEVGMPAAYAEGYGDEYRRTLSLLRDDLASTLKRAGELAEISQNIRNAERNMGSGLPLRR